ncbi:MAG TPA: glycosyltransferase [Solirubrobacteraceae bacterium]|nr:glycosyltransferase [Solirubrobacteraceae bacterium]
MNDSVPPASVIIRTKDSARTLGRALASVRAQTVACEIIVVDSGSTDGTLEIARKHADCVIEIEAARFSFGRALNVGAAAARAPIHFALSSHSFPPDSGWIERSLSKYARPDVAGTSGALTIPGTHEPLLTTFYQTLAGAIAYPAGAWFSNTGSSWRAEAWAIFPFDERLPACEDKEWSLRVLAAGWTIAVDSTLAVSQAHRRNHGIRQLYLRTQREFAAMSSFVHFPPLTARDLLREWLIDIPANAPYRGWRSRSSYFRIAELLGKYQGLKTRDAPARPLSLEPPIAGTEGTVDGI